MNENDGTIQNLAHELWTMGINGPAHKYCPNQTAKGKPKDNGHYENGCEPCQKHLEEIARVVVESDWLSERIAEGVSS